MDYFEEMELVQIYGEILLYFVKLFDIFEFCASLDGKFHAILIDNYIPPQSIADLATYLEAWSHFVDDILKYNILQSMT